MMSFFVGDSYTRKQIHAVLGGETVTYLSQQSGRIVCGCFSTDSNPDAPYEVLAGRPGPTRDDWRLFLSLRHTGPSDRRRRQDRS